MIWTKYILEPDIIYWWHIGEVQYYLSLQDKEIQIARKATGIIEKNDFKKIGKTELPQDIEWKSYIIDKSASLILRPSMPARPLVIKTEHDIFVLPGKSLTLFAQIPVWLSFYIHSENPANLLLQDPSVELSSTWFGPVDNGVLSFSLYSPVMLTLEGAKSKDYEIICPLKISNDAGNSLKLERISLDVDHLKIYSGDIGLCTNEVRIKYKGENSLSDTSFGKQAPGFLKDAKLLAQERDPDTRNILRKSFDFLMTASFS